MVSDTGYAKIQCRIFQPPKSTMQSGRTTGVWMLEYEAETARRPEPLMGWIASGDTLNQVRLRFTSKEDAVTFAEREGLDYSIEIPKPHRVQPRTYADNFRYSPPKPVSTSGK